MTEKEENIKEVVKEVVDKEKEEVNSDEYRKKLKKAEDNKKYYERHKEKIFEKVVCDICGKEYYKTSKSRHFGSTKHKLLEEIYELKKNNKKE